MWQGSVVIADSVFTATAVVLQPLTGVLLAQATGWPLSTGWIALSIVLYGVTGAFWLPVVWIQIGMRNLAREAAEATLLPAAYDRLFRVWFRPVASRRLRQRWTILWLMLKRSGIVL